MFIDRQKLVRLRQARGWSPEQLAAEAGVAGSTIRAIEPRNVQLGTAKRIADALGVDVHELESDDPLRVAS